MLFCFLPCTQAQIGNQPREKEITSKTICLGQCWILKIQLLDFLLWSSATDRAETFKEISVFLHVIFSSLHISAYHLISMLFPPLRCSHVKVFLCNYHRNLLTHTYSTSPSASLSESHFEHSVPLFSFFFFHFFFPPSTLRLKHGILQIS